MLIKNEIHKFKGQPKYERVGKIEEEIGKDACKIGLDNNKSTKRHYD